jgi:hypothetical protein
MEEYEYGVHYSAGKRTSVKALLIAILLGACLAIVAAVLTAHFLVVQ